MLIALRSSPFVSKLRRRRFGVQGSVVHCVARANISHCFIDKLREGSIYCLKDFRVVPNKDEYRIVKNCAYMLELQGSTIVSRSNSSVVGFVRYPFDIVQFEDMEPTGKKHFVDVVGRVTKVGGVFTNNKGSKTLDVSLLNQRGREMRVTLWGHLGDEFIRMVGKKTERHSVIMTSMSVKEYIGLLSLSSSSATLIYDSFEIPALTKFIDTMSAANIALTNDNSLPGNLKHGTLSELLSYSRDKSNAPVKYLCEVDIVAVRTRNSWYNFTCQSGKCRKGVSRREGNFWCDACDTSVNFPRVRFRLQLDIKDDTASAVVVCFDETAEVLAKTTAKHLLESQNNTADDDDSVIPPCLLRLVGTTQLMEMRSNTYYRFGDYESFNCSAVLDLPAGDIEAEKPSEMKTSANDAQVPCDVSGGSETNTGELGKQDAYSQPDNCDSVDEPVINSEQMEKETGCDLDDGSIDVHDPGLDNSSDDVVDLDNDSNVVDTCIKGSKDSSPLPEPDKSDKVGFVTPNSKKPAKFDIQTPSKSAEKRKRDLFKGARTAAVECHKVANSSSAGVRHSPKKK